MEKRERQEELEEQEEDAFPNDLTPRPSKRPAGFVLGFLGSFLPVFFFP